MKVLNLRCARGHGFEGWFASEADYQAQQSDGRVECPLCADRQVSRLPSAPRLNLSKSRDVGATKAAGPVTPAAPAAAPDAGQPPAEALAALQTLWMQAVRQVVANTEDVWPRFAEEARRIHYGEA